MDEAKNHILNKEFCLFDEKVKRCNGFVILTASVYHPKSRKLVARTDSRYNIQLQVAYKAFVNGAGKGEKGLSLLEKQHKATRDQIRKPRQLAEALIREDLCDEDHISALQDQDAHFMSLINRISLQKQCFIFVRNNNALTRCHIGPI